MLPNMYYRSGVMELGPIRPIRKRRSASGCSADGSLTIPLVMEDTTALLAYADGQPPRAPISSAPSATA